MNPKKAKAVGYIVVINGGGFLAPSSLPSLGTVLAPSVNPVQFPTQRSAERLIARSAQLLKSVKGSLLDGWVKLDVLAAAQAAQVVPVYGPPSMRKPKARPSKKPEPVQPTP